MVQHTDKDGSIANVMQALQAGHLTQAVALSDALIQSLRAKGSSDLDLADAHHLRGMARRELGQLDAALEDMRRACEWDRANAMLWLHIGQVEQRMGALAAAAQSLQRATQLKPALEEAWFALGVVLQAQQAWSEARTAFAQVLLLPNVSIQVQSIAHNHLGIALRHLEQLEASVTHFKRALELDPTMVEARLNLAQSYALLHRLPQAQAEIQRCVIQHPEVADVHVAWSEALAETDAPAALAALRRAVALQPAYRLRFARRIHRLERQLCDWSDFEASVAATLQAAHTQDEELGDLFITLSIPGFGRDLQRQRADKWALALQREARGSVASTPLDATSIATPAQRDTRLRLGYLSADLHTHPTAWLMAEVFELHERARFDVVAYSLGPDDASPMRQRLEKAFETFRDLRGMTLTEVDARIRADQLDILVDLKGYTQDARPEILALRPAPIQVSYLGYPATLGGDFMDYIIADEIVLPEAHQVDYSEKAVYLPQSYQCNDRQRAVAERPTRKAAGLPEQGVVLCCFNTSYKLTPEFFAIWCAVLREVPDSVLWLLDGGEAVRTNLTQFAVTRGVDAARLVFAPKLPHAQHLARLSLADMFLDTLPYNAHTTASDALWVGVPVVTCMGDTFAGRVAASLLHAVGLDELVTDDLAAYQALVLRLVRDPAALARLRKHLQDERLRCPLFDSERFTRDLESAYERIWARHQAGLPPDVVRVEPTQTPLSRLNAEPVQRPWYLRWLG